MPPAFDPPSGELTNAAEVQCCTSDITLAEFRTLEGRMEGVDPEARSLKAYLAVYLDDRYDLEGFDHRDPASWSPNMEELAEQGVKILAPPMWMLLEANPDAGEDERPIVPSVYAECARAAGLELIAWSFERSGPLTQDGEWYHQSIDAVMDNEGDKLLALDVLARDVGIRALFSDWPATVTFYDNCMSPDA